MIGWQKSRHFHSQSEAKAKPTVTPSGAYSRALGFASSFDWLTAVFSSVVFGQLLFGFCFATLKINENRSKVG